MISISRISINGIRGLNVEDIGLKPITVIIGRNNSGKTSLLEALFLASITMSSYDDNMRNSLLNAMFNSRGDVISSIWTLIENNAELTISLRVGESIKDFKCTFSRIEKGIRIELHEREMRESNVITIKIEKAFLLQSQIPPAYPVMYPSYEYKVEYHRLLKPIFITSQFLMFELPERIVSYSEKFSEGKSKLELRLLIDEVSNTAKLHYDKKPIYVYGRGFVKKILIEEGLNFANPILIDEIEDSLHPDLLAELFKAFNDVDKQIIFTTHSNEVIKLLGKYVDPGKVGVVIMKDLKAVSYINREDVETFISTDDSLSWIKAIKVA
ncbi:AAA family ATPase [Caldivirga sp.]|uniref:AAA family ATPase n=1 Tax=Caldivirga sp. TaxID=2080243 RepID=UPI003D0E59B0